MRAEFTLRIELAPKFADAEAESTYASAVGTTSRVVGASTVIIISAEPVSAPPSVTLAVMRCMPALRGLVKLPPVPRVPSRSEVQARPAVRSPSSRSFAVPTNWIGTPAVYARPASGAVIATSGGVSAAGCGVTLTWSRASPVSPRPSVTAAVMVWSPRASVVLTVAPPPRSPWRSERQASEPERSSPAMSVAVPCSVIGSPTKKLAPSDGCRIRTLGAGPVATVRRRIGFRPTSEAADL